MKRFRIFVLTVFLVLSSLGVASAGPKHVSQSQSGTDQAVGDACTDSETDKANVGLDRAEVAVDDAEGTSFEEGCGE